MSRRRTVAMVVNDDASCLDARGIPATIASMLASTGVGVDQGSMEIPTPHTDPVQ